MFNELHFSNEGSTSTIGTNGGACNDYDNEVSVDIVEFIWYFNINLLFSFIVMLIWLVYKVVVLTWVHVI